MVGLRYAVAIVVGILTATTVPAANATIINDPRSCVIVDPNGGFTGIVTIDPGACLNPVVINDGLFTGEEADFTWLTKTATLQVFDPLDGHVFTLAGSRDTTACLKQTFIITITTPVCAKFHSDLIYHGCNSSDVCTYRWYTSFAASPAVQCSDIWVSGWDNIGRGWRCINDSDAQRRAAARADSFTDGNGFTCTRGSNYHLTVGYAEQLQLPDNNNFYTIVASHGYGIGYDNSKC